MKVKFCTLGMLDATHLGWHGSLYFGTLLLHIPSRPRESHMYAPQFYICIKQSLHMKLYKNEYYNCDVPRFLNVI